MIKSIILDPGHGGIINGLPVTPGKRSPLWSDNSILVEGEFTRDICKMLEFNLNKIGVEVFFTIRSEIDLSLEDRVKFANQIHKSNPNCLYLSVHSNAGGGTGFEAYSSKGKSKADEYVKIFYEEFKKSFPKEKTRSSSPIEYGKEENFYVLKNTNMPAVLTESLFMDTERECREILMSKQGRLLIVNFHFEAIKRILKLK